MATTALIFEIIIIGFQVMVWIALSLSIFFGQTWLQAFDRFSDWELIVSALLLGLSYTLGLIFNRVIEELFFRYSRVRQLLDDLPEHPMVLRVRIWTQNAEAADRLEVWARECALLRATAVNAPLISIIGFILILKVWGFSWLLFFIGLLVSTVITKYTYWSWHQAAVSYYGHLMAAHQQLIPPTPSEQPDEEDQAGSFSL